MARLTLPTVTLCAASSVNVSATMLALHECLGKVDFADCLFFTDADVEPSDPAICVVPIARLESARAYSEFMLHDLVDHVRTEHCLVVQWDGFVLDAQQWDPAFLAFDYVGAVWPQFTDGREIGNGGFSLRSRKLLESCRDAAFQKAHPEDVAICRVNRELLESSCGIRFADRSIAERFSFERTTPSQATFGFHGIFNMIPLLGADRFWSIYRTLDEPGTAFTDYWKLMHQLESGQNSALRRLQLTADRLGSMFTR